MAAKILPVLSFFLLFSTIASDNIFTLYNEDIKRFFDIEKLATKIMKSLDNNPEAALVTLLMIDSSTKIPSGFLGGNFFDLGNFEECLNIKSGDIYGKYCLGTLHIDLGVLQSTRNLNLTAIQPRMMGAGGQYTGIHYAVCVPSSWKAEDIPGLLTYTEDMCYSKAKEESLSAGAIATIVILSIVLLLMIASTTFDIFLYYTERESPHELLLAFSVWTNGRKLFKTQKNPDQLQCLHGIRALSMMWVILGHEYTLAANAPMSNFFDMTKWQMDKANGFIKGATVSVDSFFLMGGLVTVYSFLKAVDKGVKFNVVSFYIHRYLRLTPALVIVSLINLFMLDLFGSGPLWKVVDLTLVEPCQSGWWSTFLYITNYVQKGNCLPQSWYLTVDMQLFVLSPFILIPLAKWPRYGLMALGSLIIAGIIAPFVVGWVEHIGTMFTDQNFQNVYYIQTYTRFGPYVIGMALGYLIYQIRKTEWRPNLPKVKAVAIACVAWVYLAAIVTACVYAGFDLTLPNHYNRWGNSLFLAFDRNGWALGLGGVILLCIVGYGGPIDAFLSLPIFQFLAKLSYAMYLTHYTVLTVRYSAMKNLYEFTTFMTMYNFWSDFMFIIFLSILLSLSFESPIIIIEKVIFGRGDSKRDKKLEV